MMTSILSFIARVLTRLGIRPQLYLIVREGLGKNELPDVDTPYRLGWLDRSDIEQAHALEPSRARSEVESWFAEGQRIFGIRDGSRLIGRTVCNLVNIPISGINRPLEDGEVYLHSICVDPEYRGQGIAPLMRSRCYEALRQDGFDRFHSVTWFVNQPAKRFKQKLGAVDDSLLFCIEFFERWNWSIRIKLRPGKAVSDGNAPSE